MADTGGGSSAMDGVAKPLVSYASIYKNIQNEDRFAWDFVREAISNSYDARAKTILMFPHYLADENVSVLLYFDDGVGMDVIERTRDDNAKLRDDPKSTLEAYLQIGMSTKTGGMDIGRKCVGSKQMMQKADAGFVLITRTERMESEHVIVIDEENIDRKLSRGLGVRWRRMTREAALEVLEQRLDGWNGDGELDRSLHELQNRVTHMKSGTLQVFASRNAQFHKQRLMNLDGRTWPKPSKGRISRLFVNEIELSVLVTAIRFSTRHGSVLIDTDNQFPDGMARTIRTQYTTTLGSHSTHGQLDSEQKAALDKMLHAAELKIFCNTHPEGYSVKAGYPRPREQAAVPPNPDQCKTIRTGCWARLGPVMFTDDKKRPFFVVWDQNSYENLLQDFEQCTRSKNKRSDFESLGKLSSGFRVDALGVRVCDLPSSVIEELPVQPDSNLRTDEREKFICLMRKGDKAGAVCTISGNFELNTDRHRLSQTEIIGLKSNMNFRRGLANALAQFMANNTAHGNMLRHLLKHVGAERCRYIRLGHEKEREARLRVLQESTYVFLFARPDVALPEWLKPACMTHFAPQYFSHEAQLQHLLSLFQPFATYACAHHHEQTPPRVDANEDVEELAERTLEWRAVQVWRFLRVAMHHSTGVDGTAIVVPHEGGVANGLARGALDKDRVVTINVELKWELPNSYNHALQATDVIVVWDDPGLDPHDLPPSIEDTEGCAGNMTKDVINADEPTPLMHAQDQAWPRVDGFGYIIETITKSDQTTLMSMRDTSSPHRVRIIVLKQLIESTFRSYCQVSFKDPHVPTTSKKAPKRKR